MDYSVELKAEALVSLESVTQVVKNRITRKIYWLAANFDLITPESLTGNLAGLFKLRVGDYRVV
ncbi:type II toxin-antitoxin system RelE/ParE family toxin [Aerosakkonema sp. BLCC-F183]|uniref:type II toxin-antitoxin system RelE family toxin n=1 Tax=Aerosakkonema sp. BLCC-F183 TaxID=3342834 RepID=UPI0035B9AECD